MRNQNPKTNGNVIRTIAAIIFAFLGFAGSVQLRKVHFIGEASFVGLILASAICGVVITFIDRIQSFSLRDLKVEFARIEETRKEIEKREKRVTDIARIMSEITDKDITQHGLLFGETIAEENKRWMTQKNAQLKAIIDQQPSA